MYRVTILDYKSRKTRFALIFERRIERVRYVGVQAAHPRTVGAVIVAGADLNGKSGLDHLPGGYREKYAEWLKI